MNANKSHTYHSPYGTVTVSFWYDASVCKISLPAANRVTVNRVVTRGSLNFKYSTTGWQCLPQATYLYRLDNGRAVSAAAQRRLSQTFVTLLTNNSPLQDMRRQALEATVQDYEAQIEQLLDQVRQQRSVIAHLKQQAAPLAVMTTAPPEDTSQRHHQSR